MYLELCLLLLTIYYFFMTSMTPSRLILLCSLLLCALPVVAQDAYQPDSQPPATKSNEIPEIDKRKWHVGLKLGFGVPIYRGTPVDRPTYAMGFHAAIHYRHELKHGFSIQPELYYHRKNAGAIYTERSQGDSLLPVAGTDVYTTFDQEVRNDTELSFDYFELPVLVRYDYLQKKGYSAYLMFGPQLSYIGNTEIRGRTEVFVSNMVTPEVPGAFEGLTLKVFDEPVEPDVLNFNPLDFGLVFGGGAGYDVGYGRMFFETRININFPDIESQDIEMRSGGFSVLYGYEF